MIEAIGIDVDDTLCLTEAACYELENDTLVAMGRVPMSREVHIDTWGQPLFEAITLRSPGIDVEAFKEAYHPIIDEYTRSGKLDVIPEANYLALDQLLDMGIKLIIVTSRTHGELKHMLEADHALASRITAFYHKDNTEYHKPNPRVFDAMFAEHALQPERCLYVGDSVTDAMATKEAGMHFVASLESGLRQRADFDRVQVDEFIDRFPDLVQVVKRFDDSKSQTNQPTIVGGSA